MIPNRAIYSQSIQKQEITMKTVLLIGINAKYIHSNPAVYCLKAYADKYYPNRPDGCELAVAEYTINQQANTILADLYEKKPQAAAFSCYIWNWRMIQDLLAELPKVLPDTDIWLGGPEVSFRAQSLMQEFPQITGIMVGEGENTFLELLHYYWEHTPALSDIKGIVSHDGFSGIRPLMDINRLPFLYDFQNYDTRVTFNNRILYYESQRGCPFQCAYCLSSIDKTVRLRDIDAVKSELDQFLASRVPQVKFIDRTFNCNSRHALTIWRYLKENDNGVTNFHFEIAADLITDEQLNVMRDMRPGLIQLEIGVQSTNEDTLKAINRYMDINRLKETVAAIRGFHNIHQHLDLIAGLPFEDYDSFGNSFNDVYAMAPNQLQLGFLKVLNGSPIAQHAEEYGIVYTSNPPYEVLYTKWLDFEDVLKLKGIEEMVELYYNSNQFTHVLPVLVQEFSSPFQMFEALAAYYRTNGYFTNTPSRTYRYQVLLDFACSVAGDRREVFIELLTFDLYLRENLKSRPDFCPNNALDKEKLRLFFEREVQNPQYLKNYAGFKSAQLLRMTHVERFSYPVWHENPNDCTVRRNAPAYILFDYENRNALTHDAAFYEIIR